MNNIFRVIPWRRLIRVGKPFWSWQSEMRKTGMICLGIVLTLLGGNALVAVAINHVAGNFMTAIEMRSQSEFLLFLSLYLVLLAVTAVIQVFYSYFRTRLALLWRSWLSRHFFDLYFANRVFVQMSQRSDIDFTEQRMSQDVDSFCNSAVGLFIALLDAGVNVVTFMLLLWVISPTLSITVMLYSAVGFLVVIRIGKDLVSLCNKQLNKEADLRDALAEARKEAVQIERQGRTLSQKVDAQSKLATVIETLLEIARVNRNIQMFTNIFNLLVPVIPAVLIAPAYFRQEIPFGTITQAVLAFGAVFHGATIFIGQFNGITNFAAVINRLGSLIETMESYSPKDRPRNHSTSDRAQKRHQSDRVSSTSVNLAHGGGASHWPTDTRFHWLAARTLLGTLARLQRCQSFSSSFRRY